MFESLRECAGPKSVAIPADSAALVGGPSASLKSLFHIFWFVTFYGHRLIMVRCEVKMLRVFLWWLTNYGSLWIRNVTWLFLVNVVIRVTAIVVTVARCRMEFPGRF